MKIIRKTLYLVGFSMLMSASVGNKAVTRPTNTDLNDTSWQLLEMANDNQAEREHYDKVTIRINDNRLTGSASVNQFSGPIDTKNGEWQITSSAMMMTAKASLNESLTALEDAFMSSLSQVNRWEISSNQLYLLNDNQTLLTFESMTP